MIPKVNNFEFAMHKCSCLISLINIESGPPEFDLGYLILEPVARVDYLDLIFSKYSAKDKRLLSFHPIPLSFEKDTYVNSFIKVASLN